MKKISRFLIIIFLLFSSSFSVQGALRDGQSTYTPLNYPQGDDFVRLKEIIDATFSIENQRKYTNCIIWWWACPNYKYTSISEKALKYITLKTYSGNEDFYSQLFSELSYSRFHILEDSSSLDGFTSSTSYTEISRILSAIPKGTPVNNFLWSLFWTTPSWDITQDLISASFGVDFTENAPSNTMLSAIETKIKELKVRKCQMESGVMDSVRKCPPWTTLSNRYLPTQEDLLKETIFLNGSSLKIQTLEDEFQYSIVGTPELYTKILYPKLKELEALYQKVEGEQKVIESQWGIFWAWTASIANSLYQQQKQITNYLSFESVKNGLESIERQSSSDFSDTQRDLVLAIRDELNYFQSELEKQDANIKYTLDYKKNSFSLEEAKAVVNKKLSFSEMRSESDCIKTDIFPSLTECQIAMKAYQKIQFGAHSQYLDTEKYPTSPEQIKDMYIGNPDTKKDFNAYFSYTVLTPSGAPPQSDIKLKKDIWNRLYSPEEHQAQDYSVLLSWATLPAIPSIFSHIPKDNMALYVKNPQQLLALIDMKHDMMTRVSGIDISLSMKQLLEKFFEVEDFTLLQKNLKHEVVFMVDNLDLTSPDITMILSESDKAAFTPKEEPRFTAAKDGFIFIANSQLRIDQLVNLSKKDSLSEALDFQYVWWKKSSQVQDAFFFVWDLFFEKILSLESYLTHYRKYQDVSRLSLIQELAWAYEEAFEKSPFSIDMLWESLSGSSMTGEYLSRYTINNGIVSDPNIGSLKNIKTLRENSYDLSDISRLELESYKTNVLKYKDIWRASLDPMGIILNRYGDGIEIDFFMTPIPVLLQSEFTNIQKIFEWVTKDSLSFLTNTRIRMGLLSFIVGFDPKKFEQKMLTNTGMSRDISQINNEILDDKNIFDYIGWEAAFSLGNLPDDIFDWWNTEKIDAYLSLQVASEEKWKELIGMIRKKIADISKKKTSFGFSEIEDFLAKPLIEDYKWRKIYYAEALSVPFVWKVSFAYTFIDDFFLLAPNRMTIRRIIDTALSGDTRKSLIIDTQTASTGSFFAMLFDGEWTSQDLKWLYQKNKTNIPRSLFASDAWFYTNIVSPLLSRYHASSLREKKLGRAVAPFEYTLGWLSLHAKDGDIRMSLDQKKYNNLSGSLLDTWNALNISRKYPKEVFTEDGIPLDGSFWVSGTWNIFSLAFMIQLDDIFALKDSLFQNMTFSLNMGNDTIWWNARVFREKDKIFSPTSVPFKREDEEISEVSNRYDILLIGVVILVLTLLAWVIFFFWKKRKNDSMIASSSAAAYAVPVIVDDSAAIIIGWSISPLKKIEDMAISSPLDSPIVSASIILPEWKIPEYSTLSPSPMGSPGFSWTWEQPSLDNSLNSKVTPLPNSIENP